MKKSLVGFMALGFVFTGCIGDSDDEKGIKVGSGGEKNLYEKVLIKDGYFTDSRDNNKYKIAKIGGHYWFAENLRYADSSEMTNLKGNIRCLDNKPKNCEKFGPLYTWTGAMDLEDSYTEKEAGTLKAAQFQGACPNGWTIPSVKQWKDFLDEVGILNGDEGNGTSLKSISTWDKVDSVPGGMNRFGFDMLAGGRANNDGNFQSGGKYAYVWAADEVDEGTAKGFSFHYDKEGVDGGEYYKDHGMSVRCILADEATLTVEGDLDSSYIAELPFDYGSVKVDGKSYKTIKIGSNTWMAENLNYKTENSWCYNNDDSSCKKFGRLYDWETALTICPEGWKLPSRSDFNVLIANHKDPRFIRSTEEWKNDDGLNFWGFNLLPAGGFKAGDFFDAKVSAYLWSSDAFADSESYALFVNYYGDSSVKSYSRKAGYSVRCIKE